MTKVEEAVGVANATSAPLEDKNGIKEEAVKGMAIDYEKENRELKKQMDEMKAMMASLMALQSQQPATQSVVVQASKMDKLYTVVHMVETYPGLDSVVRVDGKTFTFSKFGEKKVMKFEDLQRLVSEYRTWFQNGILALGSDCEDIADDFGLDMYSFPIDSRSYYKLGSLADDEFEKIVSSLNKHQIAHLANAWVIRYRQGQEGYDDLNKIRLLNKLTDGLLKGFISEMTSE